MKFNSLVALLGLFVALDSFAVGFYTSDEAVGITSYKSRVIKDVVKQNETLLEDIEVHTVSVEPTAYSRNHYFKRAGDRTGPGYLILSSRELRTDEAKIRKKLDLLFWGLTQSKSKQFDLLVYPDWFRGGLTLNTAIASAKKMQHLSWLVWIRLKWTEFIDVA